MGGAHVEAGLTRCGRRGEEHRVGRKRQGQFMNQRTIVCTQGTSIGAGIRMTGDMTVADYRAAVERRIEEREKELPADRVPTALSAELNSLAAMEAGSDDSVVLVATETEDGRVCAELCAERIAQHFGCEVSIRQVDGLQVSDREAFARRGIPGLFAALREIIGPNPEYAGDRVVLNASGGFKGVVPYITLFGLMHRIPVTYIFEFTNTLITLPPAPVHFDWDLLAKARDAFLRLRSEGAMPRERFFELLSGADHLDRERIATLLEEEDGLVTASPIGELVFESQHSAEGQVLINPVLAEKLEAAPRDARRTMEGLLRKVSDPLWRSAHVHRFKGTDLLVSKPGPVSERLAYTPRGREIYVAEIFLHHDNYERELNGRHIADYDLSAFLPWQPTEAPQADDATDAEQALALQQALDSARNALEQAEQRIRKTAGERDHARQQREKDAVAAAQREKKSQQTMSRTISKRDERIRELEAELERLRAQHSAAAPSEARNAPAVPWWRRIFPRASR